MDCQTIEQRLSEYLESSLPAEEMIQVSKHLERCPGCCALSVEMAKVVSLCHDYPVLDMDLDLTERILLRTSGRPRTRSIKEQLNQFFRHTLLTPRFAAGASLATVFILLFSNLLLPPLAKVLSPRQVSQFMDRSFGQIYGEALRAYEKKNQIQAEFDLFRTSTVNRIKSILDQLDAPVETHGKTEEGIPEREEKRSELNEPVSVARLSRQPEGIFLKTR